MAAATETEVQAAESRLGVRFPADYREYLLRQNGKVIWLQRDICRLEAPGRPLLRESGLSELYRQRCALYEHFSDEAILNNGAPEDALRRLKECMV